MERFVLRNKHTGEFFKSDKSIDAKSPIDGLIFGSDAIARLLASTKAGYELCRIQFSVNSCEPVTVN